LKVKKIHGDSVKNGSARTKKSTGERAPNAPPPACLRLKKKYLQKLIISRFRKRHFINSFDVLKNHELNCMVFENQGFPQISNLSSSSQKSEKSLL